MTDIEVEFAHAKANGWLPMFAEAGSSFGFTAALLMAIASRETNMKNIVGDGGHGYGLMQIDVRSYPDFCHSGAWKNVEAEIHMGASVLSSKQVQIQKSQGVQLHISSSSFVGKKLTDGELNQCAVAAYNAGLWAYYGITVHGNPDLYTTAHNYSSDVISRMRQFSKLLTPSASG